MKYIKYKEKDFIAYILINRPKKLNSLSSAVIDELINRVDYIQSNKKIRAVIITGAGNKAFIAGADITEMAKMNVDDASNYSHKGQLLTTKIENSRVPFIAAINGYALGGGCEIALACHIRYADQNAKFGQPEVSLGLIAGFGGTQRLPRLIGKGRATELLLSGEIISSDKALCYGLVNKIINNENTDEPALIIACEKLCAKISANSSIAITKTIQSINEGISKSIEQSLIIEKDLFSSLFNFSDTKEGMQAFIEKRKPVFKKK